MSPHKQITRDRLGTHLHKRFRMRQTSCDFRVMSNRAQKAAEKNQWDLGHLIWNPSSLQKLQLIATGVTRHTDNEDVMMEALPLQWAGLLSQDAMSWLCLPEETSFLLFTRSYSTKMSGWCRSLLTLAGMSYKERGRRVGTSEVRFWKRGIYSRDGGGRSIRLCSVGVGCLNCRL